MENFAPDEVKKFIEDGKNEIQKEISPSLENDAEIEKTKIRLEELKKIRERKILISLPEEIHGALKSFCYKKQASMNEEIKKLVIWHLQVNGWRANTDPFTLYKMQKDTGIDTNEIETPKIDATPESGEILENS
jgi:hypothetical protein